MGSEAESVINFKDMEKEIENLILESANLNLATRNAFNSVDGSGEQEMREVSLNDTESQPKLRIHELEEDMKRMKDELEKKTGNESKSNHEEAEGVGVPLAQRERFTREEMARVLMERNQYKEHYLELQDAVRLTEMLRAAKQDPSLELDLKRSSKGILNLRGSSNHQIIPDQTDEEILFCRNPNYLKMSTPDKTSETLNLAEEMNANPSQSDSKDDTTLESKPDDALNANLTESMTRRLNDIDLSFRQAVVTKDSSSDFIHEEADQHFSEDEQASATEGESETDSLTVIKPDSDHKWKPKVGDVYNRVLEIQKSRPKKYNATSFSKPETVVEENLDDVVEVKPEVVSCPKCGRKVAAGAINRHIQFCTPPEESQ